MTSVPSSVVTERGQPVEAGAANELLERGCIRSFGGTMASTDLLIVDDIGLNKAGASRLGVVYSAST